MPEDVFKVADMDRNLTLALRRVGRNLEIRPNFGGAIRIERADALELALWINRELAEPRTSPEGTE